MNLKKHFGNRDRERWLLHGDDKTKFFHRVENGQKGKITMFSLQNGPNLVQGTTDMLSHATTFYKNLFLVEEMSHTRLRDDVWSEYERLSD
jgi:hypothetical protein